MNETMRPMIVSTEDYKQQQIAQSKSDAAELFSDETVEGGRYEVDGRMVNANGEPVKDEQKASAEPVKDEQKAYTAPVNDEQKAYTAPQNVSGKTR